MSRGPGPFHWRWRWRVAKKRWPNFTKDPKMVIFSSWLWYSVLEGTHNFLVRPFSENVPFGPWHSAVDDSSSGEKTHDLICRSLVRTFTRGRFSKVVSTHRTEHPPKPLPTGYFKGFRIYSWRTGCALRVCCNFLGVLILLVGRVTGVFSCWGPVKLLSNQVLILGEGRDIS